jgi:hypothetical protein
VRAQDAQLGRHNAGAAAAARETQPKGIRTASRDGRYKGKFKG